MHPLKSTPIWDDPGRGYRGIELIGVGRLRLEGLADIDSKQGAPDIRVETQTWAQKWFSQEKPHSREAVAHEYRLTLCLIWEVEDCEKKALLAKGLVIEDSGTVNCLSRENLSGGAQPFCGAGWLHRR